MPDTPPPPTFQPEDTVRARLWPELGTGKVLRVTKPVNAFAARTARVHWPDANQTSTHSFSALKHTEGGSAQ